jgi:hypothetical protein
MIFVEEKDFNHQIALLSFLAESRDYNICAWLYPEQAVSELIGLSVSDNPLGLIPVTTYENEHKPKCTKLLAASKANFRLFSVAKAEILKNCDSLALYEVDQVNWAVSTIGHEGMCLVQDDSLINGLTRAGFNASLEVPNWW